MTAIAKDLKLEQRVDLLGHIPELLADGGLTLDEILRCIPKQTIADVQRAMSMLQRNGFITVNCAGVWQLCK